MLCGDAGFKDAPVPASALYLYTPPEDYKAASDKHAAYIPHMVFYRYIRTKTLEQSNGSSLLGLTLLCIHDN